MKNGITGLNSKQNGIEIVGKKTRALRENAELKYFFSL